MGSEILDFILTASGNLVETVAALKSSDQSSKIEDAIFKHIALCCQSKLKINDFEIGLEWFNVSKQLFIRSELKGKVVVLDFFTYCCINCMHILPDLKALESEFSIEDGLVVVGVHSAKFDNEKDSANILAAVQRYEITHPVVNDPKGKMWNELGIPCWPTLLILGPSAEPLFIIIGEAQRDDLFLFVRTSMKYFKMEEHLSKHTLLMSPASHLTAKVKGPLLFPGKIASCSLPPENRTRLAVSDTGHHRILILTPEGKIEYEIGGRTSGFLDGSLTEARFHSPQGLVFRDPDLLYVADTENHAVREINLKTSRVSTVAGTGHQGTDEVGGKQGVNQPISSPWDVCLVRFCGETDTNVLLIAMAGTHQIWGLFLGASLWWKKKQYEAGTCVALVGSGKEENRNNSYPHSAAFAQPSGLAVSSCNALFVADSESSSIRRVDLNDGKVTAVVGGDRSPTNLFCFGDVDGKQYEAKLQHPLAVAWSSSDGKLYVADSYNHKIKVVDLKNNTCSTFIGSGKRGHGIGDISVPYNVQLNEPGGLCTSRDGQQLYVADTNNHSIKVVHLAEKIVNEVSIFMNPSVDHIKDVSKPTEVAIASDGGDLTIDLSIMFEEDLHLTPKAPQKWSMTLPGSSWSASQCSGDYQPDMTVKVFVPAGVPSSSALVSVDYKLYLCRGQSECFVRNLKTRFNIVYKNSASSNIHHNFSHVVGYNGVRSTSYNVLPLGIEKTF